MLVLLACVDAVICRVDSILELYSNTVFSLFQSWCNLTFIKCSKIHFVIIAS